MGSAHDGTERPTGPDSAAALSSYPLDVALEGVEPPYRILVEECSDILAVHTPEGHLQWISPAVERLLGWSAEQRLTNSVDLIHPQDRHLIGEAREELVAGADSATARVRLLHVDGSFRWADSTARAVRDADRRITALAIVTRVVHEQLMAEQALHAAERRLALAMAASPIGLAVVGLDRRFVEVNDALCAMLRCTPAWLEGRSISDLLDPDEDQDDVALREEALHSPVGRSHHEKRLIRPDGSDLWIQHAIGVVRSEDGDPVSYVSQFIDVTDARTERERLTFLATHDPLTQTLNRAEANERLRAILAHPARIGSRVGVLFLDVDDFKSINDTYGHTVGDAVLTEVADEMHRIVRTDDSVARVGGDEFIVILPSVTTVEDVAAVGEKIRRSLDAPLPVDGHEVGITLSVGCAIADHGEEARALLKRADTALLRAKQGGRDQTVVVRD